MKNALKKPTQFGNLKLTAWDQSVLVALARYRFLTTDHVENFTRRGRHKTNKRLRELFAADYLQRPEIQKALFAYRDKRHVVHALGQRGANWLVDNEFADFPKGKGWKTANSLRSTVHLEHRLGVTSTMLAFETALELMDRVRLINREEVFLTSPSHEWPNNDPLRLPTILRQPDGTETPRGTIPDHIFGFGDARSGEEKRALFFLEYDNDTEDFRKSDPRQSSLMSKYLCYGDAYKRGLHTQMYGYRNFRVLFVVNGDPSRITKMQAIYQRFGRELCPAGAFLHTTVAEFERHGPLAQIWQTASGEKVGLLPNYS